MTQKALRLAAHQIAANRNEHPATPIVALRKLFIQERRDWFKPGCSRIGWKRGELFEVAEAVLTGGDWHREWSDCGYYLAQTWRWLWWVYAIITPGDIIQSAVKKFERRANHKEKQNAHETNPRNDRQREKEVSQDAQAPPQAGRGVAQGVKSKSQIQPD